MSEIIKGKLFLGNVFDANSPTFLQNNNITTVISVATDAKIINDNKTISVYKYNLNDDYDCDISQYFNEITELIYRKDVVLIICVAGISRSATFVLVYLMRYCEANLKQAFNYIRRKRNQICPNKKFMEYLLEEEFRLLGYNSLTHADCIQLFFYT
jgi:protein-tyrosine phosphatase